MAAWPSPQSSAQTTGYWPIRFGDPAHRVDLHAERRDPEVVDDVLGLDGEVDLLPQRHVELRGGDLPPVRVVRVLVEEGPRELLADDADLEGRVGGGLLDVGQDDVGVGAERHEHDRRDGGPDDLELGVAVDRRAVEVLLARDHVEAPDGVQDDRRDQHEDRHGDDHEHVPDRVDRAGLVRGGDGEPVDQEAEGDPQERRDDADRDEHADMALLAPRVVHRLALCRLALQPHGGGKLQKWRDRRNRCAPIGTQGVGR
jgi:hypothetical protein